MILHHEAIVAAAPGIGFQVLAWGALAANAIVFYGRQLWRRIRRGK